MSKLWFQSPRNRVNTSNLPLGLVRQVAHVLRFNPLEIGSTLQITRLRSVSRRPFARAVRGFNPLEIGSTLQMIQDSDGVGQWELCFNPLEIGSTLQMR